MMARASGHHDSDAAEAITKSMKPASAAGATIRLGMRRAAKSVTVTVAATAPKTRYAGSSADHPNRQAMAASMTATRAHVAAIRAG